MSYTKNNKPLLQFSDIITTQLSMICKELEKQGMQYEVLRQEERFYNI